MKSLLRPARALLAASVIALSTSPIAADDAKTESLKDAQDELAVLKTKYLDEHPRVKEQMARIAQLQQRIQTDEKEKQRALISERKKEQQLAIAQIQRRIDEGKSIAAKNPIIRTEIKIQEPKSDGTLVLLAAPKLVTQAGQKASATIGDTVVHLVSSTDEQNNITTNLELEIGDPAVAKPQKIKVPSIHGRPGERSAVSLAEGQIIEVQATVLDAKGITVDFPGGSLAQLLSAIKEASPEPFNLIASNEALALAIPQFSVRNARPRDLVLALDQILVGYRIDFAGSDSPGAAPTIFTLRANAPSPADVPLIAESSEKKEQFRSYPLALLGNRFPVDEVIGTLNAAWTLNPAHRPGDLRIKHHAATNILLVSSPEQSALNIVEGVMQSLAHEAQSRENPRPKY